MKRVTITLMFCTSLLLAAIPVPNQIKANFIQTVVNSENNQTLKYSGSVYFSLPNSAKWIYKEPIKKIICLMETKALVIEPELEQVTLFRLNKAIPVLKILKRAKEIDAQKYSAKFNGIKYTIYTDKSNLVKKIEYIDELSNLVTISLKNIDTKPLKKSSIECKIPDDYDIIDGRY